MQPADLLYEARVAVLRSAIEHHALNAEREVFPLVRKSHMDLQALGARMQARKSVLLAEYSAIARGAASFDEARDTEGHAVPHHLGDAGTISTGAST